MRASYKDLGIRFRVRLTVAGYNVDLFDSGDEDPFPRIAKATAYLISRQDYGGRSFYVPVNEPIGAGVRKKREYYRPTVGRSA